jgi:hypothetical protein
LHLFRLLFSIGLSSLLVLFLSRITSFSFTSSNILPEMTSYVISHPNVDLCLMVDHVGYILDNGADVNSTTDQGRSPLLYAASKELSTSTRSLSSTHLIVFLWLTWGLVQYSIPGWNILVSTSGCSRGSPLWYFTISVPTSWQMVSLVFHQSNISYFTFLPSCAGPLGSGTLNFFCSLFHWLEQSLLELGRLLWKCNPDSLSNWRGWNKRWKLSLTVILGVVNAGSCPLATV